MSGLAFEMKGVSKTYPHFTLSNVNLSLPHGQIMGFIGPNGAGKSTTIRILMGIIHQDQGDVQVLGHEMPADQVEAKRHIGFVSEDMRLYKHATLDWHMGFIASIYPEWDPRYAQQLLHRFGLRRDQKLARFSHGERVKATLLLALARRPRLLILDEPTTGLDPVARHLLLRELSDVLLDESRTILFSSHNTQDVEQLADQITFIDEGQIIESRDKESFLDQWRRLRLEIAPDAALPPLPGVINIHRSGHVVIATASKYEPGILEAFQQVGATVHGVEHMTLEEIFIANVEHSRGIAA